MFALANILHLSQKVQIWLAAQVNEKRPLVWGRFCWRCRWDLNPRWTCTHTCFRDMLLRPLGHGTVEKFTRQTVCGKTRVTSVLSPTLEQWPVQQPHSAAVNAGGRRPNGSAVVASVSSGTPSVRRVRSQPVAAPQLRAFLKLAEPFRSRKSPLTTLRTEPPESTNSIAFSAVGLFPVQPCFFPVNRASANQLFFSMSRGGLRRQVHASFT